MRTNNRERERRRRIKFWREQAREESFRGDGLMDTLTTSNPFVEVSKRVYGRVNGILYSGNDYFIFVVICRVTHPSKKHV